MPSAVLVSAEQITAVIHMVRGQRVMLDADLAALYRVPTKRLNERVNRNRDRFPADFAFRLTAAEAQALRSRIATSNVGRGGRRYTPWAFTEHGALMLAAVLNSPLAIATSIQVVRAFSQFRQLLQSNSELLAKIEALEKRYDSQFRIVFQAIKELMEPPARNAKRIGFRARLEPSHSPRARN